MITKTLINRSTGRFSIIAGLISFAPVAVLAGGFRLPDQDAFATARGEAFVATADNASAIYYNPAGIAQINGITFRGGIYGIYLDPSYKSPTSGTTFDNRDQWHAVPQIFLTYKPDDSPLTFGLGAYSPYGLGLKWQQDTGFRTVGYQSSLTYFTVHPTAAIKVLPNLSFGGGITFNYANLDLKEGLVWPAQGYDEFRFQGNGFDVGYNLGILWQPIEKLSFGASFRSDTDPTFHGHTEYYNNVAFPPGGNLVPAFPFQRVDASVKFPFPFSTVVGVSFRPSSDWNLEFNAEYTDWSTLDTVTFEQAHGFPPLLPKNVPVTFGWQSSWYYEFGATRFLKKGWLVSAGYIFNENSVPNAHYTPLVADTDKHFFSAGVGHRGKKIDFDVAYQFGYGPGRDVTGSAPSATGQTADGHYDYLSHAVLATVGFHF